MIKTPENTAGSAKLAVWTMALGASVICASAQEPKVSSSPLIGWQKLPVHGRGESRLGLPLLKAPIFIGKLGAVSAAQVSIVGAAWSPGQFATEAGSKPRYYMEIFTGALKGLILPITANSVQTLDLQTTENLSAHPAGALVGGTNGDMVQIRSCYAAEEILGATEELSLLEPVASIPAPGTAADRLALPDNARAGFSKAPKDELFYVTGSGWRSRVGGTKDQKAYPILPGEAFSIQKFSGEDSDLVQMGRVEAPHVQMAIPGGGQTGTELMLTLRGSEPLSLAGSKLLESGAVAASANSLARGDELLWFNPMIGTPRLPDRRFINVVGTGWVEIGESPSVETLIIQPGETFVLRKRPGTPKAWWLK